MEGVLVYHTLPFYSPPTAHRQLAYHSVLLNWLITRCSCVDIRLLF